jgi:hypothetical protein
VAAGAFLAPISAAHAVSVSAPVIVIDKTLSAAGFTTTHGNCVAGSPATGSQGFVPGPNVPPSGLGSYQMTVGPDSNSIEQLNLSSFAGIPLSAVTDLRYWTYVTGDAGVAPVVRLLIDTNGDASADDTLTYDPALQHLPLGGWQTWNTLAGSWVSGSVGGVSLPQYLKARPGARIVNGTGAGGTPIGGVQIAVGCGQAWTNFVGNVDELTVAIGAQVYPGGDTIGPESAGAGLSYDFEAVPPPPTVGS